MSFNDFLFYSYEGATIAKQETQKNQNFMAKSLERWTKRRNWYKFQNQNALRHNQIIFVEFGYSYSPELAYQHPALVLAKNNLFCKVLPITSNEDKFRLAYHPIENPNGQKTYYRLPKGLCNLEKDSVILINQIKTISCGRIISIIDTAGLPNDIYKEVRFLSLEDAFPGIGFKMASLERMNLEMQEKIALLEEKE